MLGEKLDAHFGGMKFYTSQLASCLELNKGPPLPRLRTKMNSQYITEIVDNLIYKIFVWCKTNVFHSF